MLPQLPADKEVNAGPAPWLGMAAGPGFLGTFPADAWRNARRVACAHETFPDSPPEPSPVPLTLTVLLPRSRHLFPGELPRCIAALSQKSDVFITGGFCLI